MYPKALIIQTDLDTYLGLKHNKTYPNKKCRRLN